MQGKKTKTKHVGIYKYTGEQGTCYYITYKIGPKLKWEKVGWDYEGTKLEDAKNLRIERIRELKHNPAMRQTNITVDEGFKRFCKIQAADNKDIVSDISRYNQHIKPYFGHLKMHNVTSLMIQEYKVKWEHLSHASKYQIIGLLMKIYNRLKELNVFSGPNPAQGVDRTIPDNERKRFLTKEEAQELLKTAKALDIEAYHQIALSLFTGLRKVEVTRLYGRDIDLTNKVLTVRGKGGKERSIELADHLVAILNSIPMSPNQPLFKEFKESLINKAIELCGFNKDVDSVTWSVSYHTLRHTFASWLVQEGVPLNTIKELMGHSTIKMTERYAKLSPKNRASAVNRLNSYNL